MLPNVQKRTLFGEQSALTQSGANLVPFYNSRQSAKTAQVGWMTRKGDFAMQERTSAYVTTEQKCADTVRRQPVRLKIYQEKTCP